MVEGVQHGVDGVFFVGYHARVGTQDAILDHTWSSGRVDGVWLNGDIVGEIGLNAAVCGHFGAPVLLISGDQTACAEATALLGDLETTSRQTRHRPQRRRVSAAGGHSPTDPRCCRTCYAAAENRRRARPRRLTPPITVAVEFIRSEMADAAAILPGAERIGGKRVAFMAEDMPMAYHAFRSLVGLASS